jgi:hypothetical protein
MCTVLLPPGVYTQLQLNISYIMSDWRLLLHNVEFVSDALFYYHKPFTAFNILKCWKNNERAVQTHLWSVILRYEVQ